MSTMRSRKVASNKFSSEEIEDIQQQVQITTKKIEHEKINLRINGERYEKKYNAYCELQGKPVPLSKEQKEKDNREKKKMKVHKVSDPIKRKKIKDKELQASQQKALKEISKNEKGLEALTSEINDIELDNADLKMQIQDLRKQKENVIKQRDQTIEANKQKEKDIESLSKQNEESNKTIKNKELTKSVVQCTNQKKFFTTSRDDLESEYHKIIEESIKREREQKKEQTKKRQMLGMIADTKGGYKGASANELEKQNISTYYR